MMFCRNNECECKPKIFLFILEKKKEEDKNEDTLSCFNPDFLVHNLLDFEIKRRNVLTVIPWYAIDLILIKLNLDEIKSKRRHKWKTKFGFDLNENRIRWEKMI